MSKLPLMNLVQELATWVSVPSSVTPTPVRLARLPSRIVLPPVSLMLIPWVLVRLVSPVNLISPPLEALRAQPPN